MLSSNVKFFLQQGEIAGERHFAIESFNIFGSVLKIWRSLKKLHYMLNSAR